MHPYFLFLLLSLASAEDTLVYVLALSRHGANYPGDAGAEWNKSPLQLTPAGATQHHLLGQFLRERYVDASSFLSFSYHPEEIAVFSADSDVCAASAGAQTVGLYPPGSAPEFAFDPTTAAKSVPPNEHDYDDWIRELKQSPLKYSMSTIPVIRSVKELSVDPESCPALETVAVTNETEASERFQPLYNELMETSEKDEEVTLEHAAELREALVCGVYEGKYYKNEEYTEELIEKTSEIKVAEDYENYLNVTHEEIRLSQVISSGFLRRLKETLESVMDDEGERKLEIYVGTEELLQAVLMDLFDSFEEVPFASTLLLELYDGTEGHYVKITYNKDMTHVEDIGSFMDRLKETIESESTIESFCEGTYKAPFYKKYVDKYWNKYGYLLVALAIVAVAVLVAVVVNCCHRKTEEELQLTKQPPV